MSLLCPEYNFVHKLFRHCDATTGPSPFQEATAPSPVGPNADEVIPRVPVRQRVMSFPIGLRILFAAQPELLSPVLRIVHRVNSGLRSSRKA